MALCFDVDDFFHVVEQSKYDKQFVQPGLIDPFTGQHVDYDDKSEPIIDESLIFGDPTRVPMFHHDPPMTPK